MLTVPECQHLVCLPFEARTFHRAVDHYRVSFQVVLLGNPAAGRSLTFRADSAPPKVVFGAQGSKDYLTNSLKNGV